MDYKHHEEVTPLCVLLSKLSEYMKNFDDAKAMCPLIKDEKLLIRCNEIWNEILKILKKKFDSDPVFGDKYLKNETKPYNKKITTNFNGYLMTLAQHYVIL